MSTAATLGGWWPTHRHLTDYYRSLPTVFSQNSWWRDPFKNGSQITSLCSTFHTKSHFYSGLQGLTQCCLCLWPHSYYSPLCSLCFTHNHLPAPPLPEIFFPRASTWLPSSWPAGLCSKVTFSVRSSLTILFTNFPIYSCFTSLLGTYHQQTNRVYVCVYYLPPFTVKFPNSRVFVCFVHCCILMVQNSDNHILAVQYIFVNKVISICKSLHCMWPNKEYNLELYNIFK